MAEQAHHPSTPIDERETFAPLWDFAGMVGGALFSPVRTLREVGQREAIVPAIFLVILVVGVSVSGQGASLLAGLQTAARPDATFGGGVVFSEKASEHDKRREASAAGRIRAKPVIRHLSQKRRITLR
jgi:hypothetical protein